MTNIKVLRLYDKNGACGGYFLENETALADLFCKEHEGWTYKLEPMFG